MKVLVKILILFAASSTAYLLFTPSLHHEKKKNNDDITERKLETLRDPFSPYEFFNMIRNYPEYVLDERGFINALTQLHSKQSIYSKNGEFNKFWLQEGPTNIGGSITCIAVHPTDTSTIFIGSVYGGIYKTTNGGSTWKPLFDTIAYMTIGSITIDKSNPNVIYAGTGDPYVDGEAFTGNGIYKSTDGGNTWLHIGLDSVGVVSRIVIHPNNNQIIYAATMGRPMRRGLDRGLYKSTDGGTTWKNILSLGNETGVMDVMIDKNNSAILYATGMRRIRTNTESIIYGNTTRIYKSNDSGNTWASISNGLPGGSWCKVNIEMHPTNSSILYACIVDTTLDIKGLYKTVNGGALWTAMDTIGLPPDIFNGFGWYFGQIRANPYNPNELFVQGVDLWRSSNSGGSWTMCGDPWYTDNFHADKHYMHFYSANRFLCSTDGGLYKTVDDGQNWNMISNIPITQFYHVTSNSWEPGTYYGGAQDNGTSSGNAQSLNSWQKVFGGDGFKPAFSNFDQDVMYVETQNGRIYNRSLPGAGFSTATNDIYTNDTPNWDMPYFISKHNDYVYTGSQYVYQSTDIYNPGFTKISPDLTKSKINGAKFHNISTLCESNVDYHFLYTGTSDGKVWRTLNGGTTWTDITGSLPDRYVTCVTTSYLNNHTVYVSHSGYKYDEYIPHIHKSTDNGTTWTDISGDMPGFAVNHILTFPTSDSLIIVATDGGVFCTKNGGINWVRVGVNMPVFPVYELAYDAANKKLLAATYARSIMSYDLGIDISGQPDFAAPNNSIFIFPNPTTNFLQVKNIDNPTLTVYDLKGSTLIDHITGNRLDISALKEGIYFIKIEGTNQSSYIKKFLKM